jgi:HK97 family phage major capsid protein
MSDEREVVSNRLTEMREQFKAKQSQIADVFAAAKSGNEYDMSRKTVLSALGANNQTEALEKLKALSREAEGLGSELQQAEMKSIREFAEQRDRAMNTPISGGDMVHAVGEGKALSFGEMFVKSRAYNEAYKKHNQRDVPATLDIDIKTLFQTGAGFAPQSVRSGLIVDAVARPIQLLDLIPTRPISQAVDKYMLETTRTNNAAETAEAGTYNEDVYVFTEETSAVKKITSSLPVTDEQLEDAPEVAAILDQRLRFGLRQRLDGQVLVGDGSGSNLTGILSTAGIQTQAKSTDPVFDAVFKAMTLVSVTGRAFPNALIFHPTDWQGVRLARTADGVYIMGNPSQPGPMSLFGLPVAICDAGSAGTAYAADLLNFTYIGERRGVNVEIGYSGTQFAEGKKLLRADLRACFTVTRPAAICKITGL